MNTLNTTRLHANFVGENESFYFTENKSALSIKEGYEDKFEQLSEGMKMLYWVVDQIYLVVNRILSYFSIASRLQTECEKIDATLVQSGHLLEPPRALLTPLTEDNILEILRHIDIYSLCIFSQINRHALILGSSRMVAYAGTCGYEGEDFLEAKDFMEKLFYQGGCMMGRLWSEHYIWKRVRAPFQGVNLQYNEEELFILKYCVDTKGEQFSIGGPLLNIEKTLQNLKSLKSKDMLDLFSMDVLCDDREVQYKILRTFLSHIGENWEASPVPDDAKTKGLLAKENALKCGEMGFIRILTKQGITQ